MSKNIVVYSDGTGQDGGVRAEQRVSNIYKMYRASRVSFDNAIDPARQVTFYDPGLGTDLGTSAITAPGRFVKKLLASIDGRGILTNIIECYTFIINHYEPGDRIYLFGFSRGAYTVRSVADLIRLCGIPTKNANDGQVPKFRRATRLIAEEAVLEVLEHGAGHPRATFESEREILARRFRLKYGSDHANSDGQSNAAPYFIGVFDTVAALGASGMRRRIIQVALFALIAIAALVPTAIAAFIVQWFAHYSFLALWFGFELVASAIGIWWLRRRQKKKVLKTFISDNGESTSHYAEWEGKNFNRLLGRHVMFARSANALDETRADFDRVKWGPTKDMPKDRDGIPTFKQYFFAGNHSDVGGSYPEAESRLSDIALSWMLQEALSVPEKLLVGPILVSGEKMKDSGEQGQALHLFPSSLGMQHCEIAGTEDSIADLPGGLPNLMAGKNYDVKVREIPKDGTVHPTVNERMNASAVQQCNGYLPYRPAALEFVEQFAAYYPKPDQENASGPTAVS